MRLCSAMTWERMRLSVSSFAPSATVWGSLLTQKSDCLLFDALAPRFAPALPRTPPRSVVEDEAAADDDVAPVLRAVEITPAPPPPSDIDARLLTPGLAVDITPVDGAVGDSGEVGLCFMLSSELPLFFVFAAPLRILSPLLLPEGLFTTGRASSPRP